MIMALGASFHVVKPKLGALQNYTSRGKSIRGFLHCPDLDTKKTEFFFLAFITVFYIIITSWSMRVLRGLRFFNIGRWRAVVGSMVVFLEKRWIIGT